MSRTGIVLLLAAAVVACGDSSRDQQPAADSTAAELPDSLALTLDDSTTVWFTAGRPDTSSAGEVCVERLLEIRRGDRRIPVPLLYTMRTPHVMNDTTLITPLYRRCVIEAWYVVHTRTGQPTRERGT